MKYLRLSVVPPTGKVRVSAPTRVSKESIRAFVVSRLEWIKHHQRKYEGQAQPTELLYQSHETHYVEGKPYLLKVVESSRLSFVELNDQQIILHVKSGTSTEKRKSTLMEWYRARLKEQIPALAAKWEPIMGVKASEWQIKIMKTKWGTCNIGKKRIWLNLELAKRPLHCLEYVVVHELVHLLERNHNAKFHRHMDTFLPHWKALKQELNTPMRQGENMGLEAC